MRYFASITLNVLGMMMLALSMGTTPVGSFNWWVVIISVTVFNVAGGIMYRESRS